jgi:hypothetical protein
MTARRYKFTILALVLALIAAIVIPLVRRNELPRLSLAADSQLEIGCTTKLTVEMHDQRATLRYACARRARCGTQVTKTKAGSASRCGSSRA